MPKLKFLKLSIESFYGTAVVMGILLIPSNTICRHEKGRHNATRTCLFDFVHLNAEISHRFRSFPWLGANV